MADKSLKNKMKILELEKPLGDLVSAMDAMTGGKFSKKRKRAAKFIEIKDKLGMKDGGLAEAIEKVKKEDAVKMKKGGMAPARGPRRMGFLGQAVDEFIETMEPFQGTVRKGETLRNVDGKTMVVRRMPNPNFIQREMMGEQGRMISDADRQMIMQMMGARRMADGGKVPAKFKGFSKLPEKVQEKIDKDLASKYKKGGEVKKKSAIKKRIAIRGFGIAKRGY